MGFGLKVPRRTVGTSRPAASAPFRTSLRLDSIRSSILSISQDVGRGTERRSASGPTDASWRRCYAAAGRHRWVLRPPDELGLRLAPPPRRAICSARASQTALGRHLSQSAQAAIDRQDYVRARDDLERLVAGSPRSAEAHHRLGRVMQLQGEWAEAGAVVSPRPGARPRIRRGPDRPGRGGGAARASRRRPCNGSTTPSRSTRIRPRPTWPRAGSSRRKARSTRRSPPTSARWSSSPTRRPSASGSRRSSSPASRRTRPWRGSIRSSRWPPTTPRPTISAGWPTWRSSIPPGRSPTSASRPSTSPNRPDVFYHLALALNADHKTADALRATERALKLAPEYADARNLSTQLRR